MQEQMSGPKFAFSMIFEPTVLALPGVLVGWEVAKLLQGPSWTSISLTYVGVLGLSILAAAAFPITHLTRGNKEKARSQVAQGIGWTLITLAAASLNSGIDTLSAQWNMVGGLFFLLFFLIAMIGYGVKKSLDTSKQGGVGSNPLENHGN